MRAAGGFDLSYTVCMNAPQVPLALSLGILAGGEGRRFGGADKGWLTLAGRSLVERVLEVAQPLVADCMVSANRNVERYAALGVRVVRDDGGAGPLAGVAALLAAARQPWLLLLPVDAVELDAAWLQDFVTASGLMAAPDAYDIVALRSGGAPQPTFALLRTRLAADARAELQAGAGGLQRWYGRQRCQWIDAPLPGNCNTPAELERQERARGC